MHLGTSQKDKFMDLYAQGGLEFALQVSGVDMIHTKFGGLVNEDDLKFDPVGDYLHAILNADGKKYLPDEKSTGKEREALLKSLAVVLNEIKVDEEEPVIRVIRGVYPDFKYPPNEIKSLSE